MALAAPRNLETEGVQQERSALMGDSDTFYKGGIHVLNAGYAVVPTNAAGLEVIGILTGDYADGVHDNALVVASGAHPRARFMKGPTWVPVSGAAQTDVGLLHYAADDATMTKTAGAKTIAYRALDFKTGYLLFDFREPITVAVAVPAVMADITDLGDLALADLADVDVGTPTNNDTLKYVAATSKWTTVAVTD